MKRIPQIKSFMTPFPYSIGDTAPLAEAQAFMRSKKIRHLPVTRDGKPLGIISDRDIKLVLGPDFAYPNPDELTVAQVMIKEAYSVDLATRVDTVLAHMARHHIGSALVTRKGKLVGVFTATDACRAFCDHLRSEHGPPDGDLIA
ncbi:MAG TPA: CBS domain-containing protein [Gammaproteobacteria bacterium]|nr:CBS domain-containing protein [Gammaproteobacteria bacterium]